MASKSLQNTSNNKTSQGDRPGCTNVSQQVMMLSQSLDHVKHIFDFISTFITLRTTKPSRMVSQHATLQVIMPLLL